MEIHRETPQGYTGEESVMGRLNYSPVEALLPWSEHNPFGADAGRHNQTAMQVHMVDEGTIGKEIITDNGNLMSDASAVDFTQSKSITLKTLENVSGLPRGHDESHVEPYPVPEEDSSPAVGEGVCGDPHLNKECKGPTEVNVKQTEQGPAGPHAAGPEGGTVKTNRNPKDSTASVGQDVEPEGQVWSSKAEVEEQSTEQSTELSTEQSTEQSGEPSAEQSTVQSGPEDGGLPAGPQGERGGLKLFLVDRLFLTAPHVKGV